MSMAPATPVFQLIRLNSPRASLHKFVNQFRRTFALGNQSSSSPLSPALLHRRALSAAAPKHTSTSKSVARWLGSSNSSRSYSNASEYSLLPVGYQLPLIDYSTLVTNKNFTQKSNLRSHPIRQQRHCSQNSFHKHLRTQTAMRNRSARSVRRMRLRKMNAPGNA